MTDVVRELQALADLAGRHRADEIVLASRRLQSLLERLRNQFVNEVIGPDSPRAEPVVIENLLESA